MEIKFNHEEKEFFKACGMAKGDKEKINMITERIIKECADSKSRSHRMEVIYHYTKDMDCLHVAYLLFRSIEIGQEFLGMALLANPSVVIKKCLGLGNKQNGHTKP